MSFHGYHMTTGSAEQELPEQVHATDTSNSEPTECFQAQSSPKHSQTNRAQQGAHLATHTRNNDAPNKLHH
eukprot:6480754-Amphidinium_carterae.1